MPSNRKSDAARRNGAKSRGPVTEEGKQTSSRNALKHGIHSIVVVLPHEDEEAYNQLQAAFLDEWQPATPTEEALVADMVNARWRLIRIETLVGATIEREMQTVVDYLRDDEAPLTDEALVSRAYTRNAVSSKTLETFERWEGRLHRTFQRALKTLRSLQSERQAKVAQTVLPASTAAAHENRQNEPTGKQPSMEQPFTRPLPEPGVKNGHKPLPVNPSTPDARPPEIQ